VVETGSNHSEITIKNCERPAICNTTTSATVRLPISYRYR